MMNGYQIDGSRLMAVEKNSEDAAEMPGGYLPGIAERGQGVRHETETA
jgi:hypothetical protein